MHRPGGTAFAKRVRPQHSTVLEASLDDSTLAALLDVLQRSEHDGPPTDDAPAPAPSAPPGVPHDFAAATAALECACTAALSRIGDGRADVALLADLTQVERAVREAETRYRDQALRAAREALARLQEITSVGRLLDAGTEAVCSLGFDRAIISRIEEDTWVPEALHVDSDSVWALEILAAGQRHPQRLSQGLPEYEIVRRRRPILVEAVQERTDVHAAIAESSGSRSYVAAPLMPSGKVIGFVHGDRYFHRDEVTEFDRDLLHLFAEGFGYALERAILLERLGSVRQSLLHPVESPGVAAHLAHHAGSPSPAPSTAPLRAEPQDDARLTQREMEVLRLLAGGDTNARIARRLVVAESTVKTHVKSILRKLDASNRAEAVARWHASDQLRRA